MRISPKMNIVKEAIVAAFIMMVLTFLLNLVPLKFEFTKPIKQEFEDFDIYDLKYSGEFRYNGFKDPNIVLVQAADSREALGKQIKQIRDLHPKVLGVDILFKRPEEANLIIEAVDNDSSVILSYRLDIDSSKEDDELAIDKSIFSEDILHTNGGYVNFLGNKYTVHRNFAPFYKQASKLYTSFSAKVSQKFDQSKFNSLVERNNEEEEIDYTATLERFDFFDTGKFNYYFSTRQLNDLKGKIVLLGTFDSSFKKDKTTDDLKFTPLNEKMNGRGFPDSYGVVIHANIISMILNGNYITKPTAWLTYTVAFVLCFLLMYYIIWCFYRFEHPKHWRFLIVQIPAILLILWLSLLLFSHFGIKFSLVPIIVSLVLSVELFWVYELVAEKLGSWFNYSTIFYERK